MTMAYSRLAAAVRDHRTCMASRPFVAFTSGFLILVGSLYWPLVPPGSDGDANSTYQVMIRLVEDFKYHISRTPGQPALDLMNMAAFSLGRKAGLVGTYLFISLLGITAFYRICSAHGVQHPFLSATCLLLSPLFVAHVTGLGDFSLSLSLFLMCLYLLNRRKYNIAALVYVAAIGSRLSYCLFVVPLMYYIYNIERDEGDSVSHYSPALKFAVISALGSLCLFIPLFAIYGLSLLQNLGWQSLSYHVSSSLYKLIGRGLGVPLSLLALSLIIVKLFKTSQHSSPAKDRWVDTFLFMTMLVTLVIFFFIPTKPEIVLPLLAAFFLYLGRHYRMPVTVCVLIAIILSGIIYIDVRDPSDDSLALRFANGFYFEAYAGAYENRKGGEAIKEALTHLPPGSVLVTNFKTCYPVDPGGYPFSAERANSLQSHRDGQLRPLGSAVEFRGIDARYVVSFQDRGLKAFLESNALAPQSDRYQIYYDPRYAALTRRWQKVDPSRYGSPANINSLEIGLLPSDGLVKFRFPSFPSWFRGLPAA